MSAARLVMNRTMNRFTSESFMLDSPGIRLANTVPQFFADVPTLFCTISMPLSPSTTASTSALRCAWSSGEMPCTAATARVNTADASMKNVVSALTAAIAATVPTPGTAAVAPTALPLPVTASRYCFSNRSMMCAGVSSGWERRIRSTYLATAGACRRDPVSSS